MCPALRGCPLRAVLCRQAYQRPSESLEWFVADAAGPLGSYVLRRGADQIKVMASGGAASPTDELDHVQFSVPELSAAVEVAGAVGTYVLAHAYAPRAIQNCLKAGVRSIEHGNFLDEATADLMLAADDVYLVS